MELVAIIGMLAVVAAVAVYKLFLEDKTEHYMKKEFDVLGIGGHLVKFKEDYVTPAGARVKSTVPVPAEFLRLVDEGINNQIVRHSRVFPHWNQYTKVSDYDVLLIEPMGTNEVTEPGSPCIFVKGVQTAGTCLGVYPKTKLRPFIVVPHQANQNWSFQDYFMRSVWHESEHVREYKNDLGIFYYWATAGDVHPHVGDE